MEPRIQDAKTADGVSIAFATYGEGRPLVWSHPPTASHVQLEWEQPVYRATYSHLAAMGMMLVRFDTRGVGLSDRDVNDISLDARVRDLEAVADHLHLSAFGLVALEEGGATAIAYATRHPERVTHLILVNCSARRGGATATPSGDALVRLVGEGDWEMLTENLAAAGFGYGREETKRYAQFLRACAAPDMLRRFTEADHEIDVSDLLGGIRSPTLVVCHTGIKWLANDASKELATGIPDSRLLVIEGLYADNTEQLFTGVADFVGVRERVETGAVTPEAGAVRTVLFTDIEGSTALTQRLGDTKAREVLREHERITRECLRAHGGAEVKTMGDGFMASFGSAVRALECAIAIQQAFEGWNADAGAHHDAPLRVRIGLNAGEPIAEDDPDGRGDLFGTAVIRAARIAALAQGGEILASNVVRELAMGKGFFFTDTGEVTLKGFEEPVRLYAVNWRLHGEQ